MLSASYWAKICCTPFSMLICVSWCWLLGTSALLGLIVQTSVVLLFTCSGCFFPFFCLLKIKNPEFCQNIHITGTVGCFQSHCRWLCTEISSVSKNTACYSHWLFLATTQGKLLGHIPLHVPAVPLAVTDSQTDFPSSRHSSLAWVWLCKLDTTTSLLISEMG